MPRVIQPVRLFTPGPVMVPADVMVEMSYPQDHHRTKAFVELLAECSVGLQKLFRTAGEVITITGSGTAAMEAAMTGLIANNADGPRALCVDSGKFGERWVETCRAFGIPHDVLSTPWGQAAQPKQIAEYLAAHPKCPAVVLVHSETSTATACDLRAVAEVIRKTDALLIVDGITSVGALPFDMDAWGVDAAVTGSQKALMLPPGLGFVALGPRAKARLKQTVSPGYYLNLAHYSGEADGEPPFTPNNQLIRGLHLVLGHIHSVGLDVIWQRTRKLAEATRAACSAIGLEVYSKQPSDSLTAVVVPANISESKLRSQLRSQFGIQLAGGQGELKGKIVRINHMGIVDPYDTLGLLGAMEMVLAELGHSFQLGASAAAALQVLTARP